MMAIVVAVAKAIAIAIDLAIAIIFRVQNIYTISHDHSPEYTLYSLGYIPHSLKHIE